MPPVPYETIKLPIISVLRRLPFIASIRRMLLQMQGYCEFLGQFKKFRAQSEALAEMRFTIGWEDRYPCLGESGKYTEFDRHYIYHPAWAARVLVKIKPTKHVDISSTLHFSTIVSAFVPVQFYDFRPANIALNNLSSEAADLLNLPFSDDSIESLSCMHVVEHVGLGRYGDKLDPQGDLKAIAELKRVLAFEGDLLFVVPVGKPKVMFNAHRIYSYEQVISYFKEFELMSFALISENFADGGLNYAATSSEVVQQNYGCGCFWFKKRKGSA